MLDLWLVMLAAIPTFLFGIFSFMLIRPIEEPIFLWFDKIFTSEHLVRPEQGAYWEINDPAHRETILGLYLPQVSLLLTMICLGGYLVVKWAVLDPIAVFQGGMSLTEVTNNVNWGLLLCCILLPPLLMLLYYLNLEYARQQQRFVATTSGFYEIRWTPSFLGLFTPQKESLLSHTPWVEQRENAGGTTAYLVKELTLNPWQRFWVRRMSALYKVGNIRFPSKARADDLFTFMPDYLSILEIVRGFCMWSVFLEDVKKGGRAKEILEALKTQAAKAATTQQNLVEHSESDLTKINQLWEKLLGPLAPEMNISDRHCFETVWDYKTRRRKVPYPNKVLQRVLGFDPRYGQYLANEADRVMQGHGFTATSQVPTPYQGAGDALVVDPANPPEDDTPMF